MFPKKGEKTPELRFLNFKNNWKQCNLSEVFKYKQGQQVPVEEQSLTKHKSTKRFIRIVDLTSTEEPKRYISYNGNNLVKKDELFMVRYGQPGLTAYGYEGVIANNLFKLVPKQEINTLFYYTLLTKMNLEIQSISSSTTMPAISFSSLDTLKIYKPSIEEQIKIGSFFKQLDDSIALQEQKLESLKQMKKAFLQKMFV
ncbi:MAG: restriction endonuclease subunit S [Alkalibacterium sp.]|nr:restriction endonuclease subunit S [Alkalibacterium sp.]